MDRPTAAPRADQRPTAPLPLAQLLTLSVYWLGMNVTWGGLSSVILPKRVEDLVGKEITGSALGVMDLAGAVIAALVQPTVGTLSDFTVSRWGRRKPYILAGTLLDVVFLVGIATSQTYLSIFAAYLLLQLASNIAQGPFQGYVPDLVPARQVGLASALMGIMIVLGRMVGLGIASIGLFVGDFLLATVSLGLLALVTAIATVLWVDDGRGAPPRAGRSWVRIALGAWKLDILRQRSFLWAVGSRLCVLMGTVALLDLMFFYLTRSLGMTDQETAVWITVASAIVGVTTMLTTIPAARLSDRLGRKRIIYASCALGAGGMLGVALAPSIGAAIPFVVLVGVATGAFLAVDWALITDIIPKATSGRYMGISNVFTTAAGPLGLLIGGVTMDLVGRVDPALGPRAAFLGTLVFFAVGALLLRPVDERRRDEP